MIHSDKERQAWHDQLAARFAQPDDQNDRHEHGGKVFVRTLGKRCPWCSRIFFAYQVEGQEREPYRVDPNPPMGRGTRDTCGNPLCLEAEDAYQWHRRMDFRAAKVLEVA